VIEVSHIGPAFDMSVRAVLAAEFLGLGAWAFSKIQV
jgi:hypothetical protein